MRIPSRQVSRRRCAKRSFAPRTVLGQSEERQWPSRFDIEEKAHRVVEVMQHERGDDRIGPHPGPRHSCERSMPNDEAPVTVQFDDDFRDIKADGIKSGRPQRMEKVTWTTADLEDRCARFESLPQP